VFEWDPAKARNNVLKHRVTFEEALTAFADSRGLDGVDANHSLVEERRLRVAATEEGRILVIAYTARRRGRENVIRIISARPANRGEKAQYFEEEN
jgi:uncharacterized protein